MRGLVRVAELVGVNAIPAVGVFAGEWSSSTALAVYWVENLVASALVAARLWLHRRWQPPAVPGAPPVAAARPPGELLLTAVPFTLAHGLFLAFIFAMVTQLAPDREPLRQAVMALLAVQGLAFGLDLWTLGDWPAARLNERADHLMGRVVLVHLSIIAGMFVATWLDRPESFFGFFVGGKLLADLSQLLPRPDRGTPERPPRWLAAIMRHVPRQGGETFEEYWRRTHQGRDQGSGAGDQGRPTHTRQPARRAKKARR
ncbi:MAG: DUF6498-containing protein [Vicinamibacterales bacterium]